MKLNLCIFVVVPVALFSGHSISIYEHVRKSGTGYFGSFSSPPRSCAHGQHGLQQISPPQIYILLDFLRDIHHFGGLAGGAQRFLNARWEKERKKKPSFNRREDRSQSGIIPGEW
jgi:hypothetical protein